MKAAQNSASVLTEWRKQEYPQFALSEYNYFNSVYKPIDEKVSNWRIKETESYLSTFSVANWS